jgi:hypothetical protein
MGLWDLRSHFQVKIEQSRQPQCRAIEGRHVYAEDADVDVFPLASRFR